MSPLEKLSEVLAKLADTGDDIELNGSDAVPWIRGQNRA